MLEGDKPTTAVSRTPEDVQRIRADLKRRRALRCSGASGDSIREPSAAATGNARQRRRGPTGAAQDLLR